MRDQAVVDLDDVTRAVHPQAVGAAGEVDVLHAGPPTQAQIDVGVVAGDRFHHEVGHERVGRIEVSQPHELLADDGRLQLALGRERDVLEVAAAAEVGTGVLAGRRDPVWRGGQDRHGVAAPEPVSLGALGDLDDHLLAGQCVPGEHDPALPRKPDDEVAAVRDRPDHGGEPLTHPGSAPCLALTRVAGHRLAHQRGVRRPLPEGSRMVCPRRTSPARSRVCSQVSRSRASSEDRSW